MELFGEQEIKNLKEVIESGDFGDHRGGFLDRFRKAFAEELGAKHAISGATAMLLMQAVPGAIGAGAGDEIICDPIVQFHGIACLHNNVVPVWADIKPDDFLMDPDSAEEKITERTKAIWVTHLWGFPAEVDKLRKIADKYGIYLLEDCAHALLAEYKGRKLGTWGDIGTFSFNQGKQLKTGEGGMAVTNDDKLYEELGKRIIFGESPEVLSSNYRMTEFQAAVGVEQLKKIPGYLKEFLEGKKLLDEAIKDCSWLRMRHEPDESAVAPYIWSCIFEGERKGINMAVFKAALKQVSSDFQTGFLQRPAYMYEILRKPNAYGNKGCPYNCHLYNGKVDWKQGLCPVSEDIIPRIVHTNNMRSVNEVAKVAESLKESVKLAESGTIKPLEYSDDEKRILDIVRQKGAAEPIEVIEIFDKNSWQHFNEHSMLKLMEGLRDRYPYKLSHAGPRKYRYHELI